MSNVDNYIRKIKDPSSWFKHYRQQKLIAVILLEKLTMLTLNQKRIKSYLTLLAN